MRKSKRAILTTSVVSPSAGPGLMLGSTSLSLSLSRWLLARDLMLLLHYPARRFKFLRRVEYTFTKIITLRTFCSLLIPLCNY